MDTINKYSDIIEQAVKSLQLPAGRLPGLYEPIAYGLDTGGKRLRPVLALIACQASCGTPDPAIPAALAVEMFHNFTLLHDDVMDNSDTRRGKPSVQKKWDVSTAILSGDTLATLATQVLCRLPDPCLRKALECFNKSAIEVYEGQQLDMEFEKRSDVSLSEYLEMIRLKTSVLLGCAAKLGALAGAATDMEADLWYAYGEALGLAFQIQDDWLDVYGDPATFGKPIGGDILNDKKTFLMLSALAGPNAEMMKQAMAMPASEEKIKTVRRIYDDSGIPQACHNAIEKYTDQAVKALDNLNIAPGLYELLVSLARNLANRTK